MTLDSFGARSRLSVGDLSYDVFRLDSIVADPLQLPYSVRVLVENLLRREDGVNVSADDIRAVADRSRSAQEAGHRELQFMPARVLMQDLTGVPAIADLAALRDAVARLGGDTARVEPGIPVDLVIDHSIIADFAGAADSMARNAELEFSRNRERYTFLRWAQQAFKTLRVFPPDRGICHQVNLEFLSQVVFRDGSGLAYPDTLVGTDSHTPMVNGLGVLGWGVGGIEAEAAMLGQAISMLLPRVVGIKLIGALTPGVTATDLVLTVAQRLREHGVVGKLVEFYGEGVGRIPLENRATIGNMSPEYGSTCTLFPVDDETLRYLRATGRPDDLVALVETYAKEQGLWHDPAAVPQYDEMLELDLGTVVPSLAGPARPQDRVSLSEAKTGFATALAGVRRDEGATLQIQKAPVALADGRTFDLADGAVVIAAITSCTNTSNPSVMIAAGLLAKNAVERGLTSAPWVKTTLAPGSLVVTDYYKKANLLEPLSALGFDLVGYGCTTCIGNSGPLAPEISAAVTEHDLSVCSVLSGNRNFEGRIHPDCRMNYLASPPLVVAYALAGTMDIDLNTDPIGHDRDGSAVYLRDIWPSDADVTSVVEAVVERSMFVERYGSIFEGDERWRALPAPTGDRYEWDTESTYIRRPPFLDDVSGGDLPITDIHGARVLALLGDSVTTDHISPAGNIRATTPAGQWLIGHGVEARDFNSYGARRGNHEVMVRGTFANVRLRNQLAPGTEGGVTVHMPDNQPATIYDGSMQYQNDGVPLLVIAGKEYGSGSSRDWAAKGSLLLGVKAVLAESYERIHRSNLVGMGVLPLEFAPGDTPASLGLTGHEEYKIRGVEVLTTDGPLPVDVTVEADGRSFSMRVRIDTPFERQVFRAGGILAYTLRSMLA